MTFDQDRSFCFACDYSLKGLPESRCPECGRAFDPGDAQTFNTSGKPIGSLARMMMKPPGLVVSALSLPAVFVPIWLAINPGQINFGAQIALMFFSLVGAGAWILRSLIRFIVMVPNYPKDLLRRQHWKWFLAPGLLLIAWCIPLESFNLWVFNRARPDLESYAREIMGNPGKRWPDRSFGLLRVHVAGASTSQVWFFVGKGYDGMDCGYVFSPEEELINDPHASPHTQPIQEHWYYYYDFSRKLPPTRPSTLPVGPATRPG